MTGKFTISKAAVVVTAENKTKVYGQDDPEFTWTAVGLQNQEKLEIEVTFSRDEGEDVGEYTINVTGPEEVDNYTIEYVPGTLEITKAKLTVTAQDKSKVYGEDDPELTWTVEGLQYSDEEDILGVQATRAEGEDVATYTITPTGATTLDNYTVEYKTGTFEITPATVTVKADDKSKVYGEDDPELTWTAEGLQNNDTKDVLKVEIARAAGEDVDTYIITPSGDAVQGNYNVVYETGTFEITPATVTVTADTLTKKYGEDDPELTWTVEGLQNEDTEDVLKVTTVRAEGETVGDYIITPSGDEAQGNYIVKFEEGTLTIEARPISFTAGSKTAKYNGSPIVADPATVDAVSDTNFGLVSGHTFTAAQANDSMTFPGSQTVTIADLFIYDADGTDVTGNYEVSKNPGELVVTDRGDDAYVITIHSDDVEIIYDGKIHTYTTGVRVAAENEEVSTVEMIWNTIARMFTLKADAAEGISFDIVDDETGEAVTYVLSGIEVSATGKDVDTYAFTPSGDLVITNDGTPVTNQFTVKYELGNLIIDRAGVTVTADNKTKVSNGREPSYTSTIVANNPDLQAEAEEALAQAEFTYSRPSGEAARTYPIVVGGPEIVGNFEITYQPGTLRITAPAPTPDEPTGGPGDPGTTTIPDAPTPLAAAPAGAVLGATRELEGGDGAAVLGARRGRTDDDANNMARLIAIVMAAAIAVSMMLTGKKKEDEEK